MIRCPECNEVMVEEMYLGLGDELEELFLVCPSCGKEIEEI